MSSKSSNRYKGEEDSLREVEVDQRFSGHRAVVNSVPVGDANSFGTHRGKNVSINMNSVRQLAKSTHNRQENSYIPHEEMSSFFRTANFNQATSIRAIPSSFMKQNLGSIVPISEYKEKKEEIIENPAVVICDRTEPLYSAARGLATAQPFMENKFQLKINIGVGESVDPQDLQVSLSVIFFFYYVNF